MYWTQIFVNLIERVNVSPVTILPACHWNVLTQTGVTSGVGLKVQDSSTVTREK